MQAKESEMSLLVNVLNKLRNEAKVAWFGYKGGNITYDCMMKISDIETDEKRIKIDFAKIDGNYYMEILKEKICSVVEVCYKDAEETDYNINFVDGDMFMIAVS